jgi:XRE family transcriptional regulator, regulator of sulfur utilization
MANHKRKTAHRDQPQPALGAAIRDLRQKRGETLKTLASKAGITWGTLGVIERGEANPTWGTTREIASALGVSLAELAKLADERKT